MRNAEPGTIGLPLVSVVITNFNYGRFLREAVLSVLSQSYPNIECVIVDDASTDNSAEVLDTIERDHAGVKIVRKTANRGQTAAFYSGFGASTGEYVVFLDADDLLLPTFVQTHVFVNLSVRSPIGFTASDMFQATQTRVVRPGWGSFGDYVVSGKGVRTNHLRRIDRCGSNFWPFPEETGPFDELVHLVDPGVWPDRVFVPTSGNCFRRDALELFLVENPPADLRINTDTYLCKAVCLISGAALIDLPLGFYRIHGENGCSSGLELKGVYAADPIRAVRADFAAWRAVVDRLLSEAPVFVTRLGVQGYRDALLAMQEGYPFNPEFVGLDDLHDYVQMGLSKVEGAVKERMGEQGLKYLLYSLREAPPKQDPRRVPRLWLRPIAEFFLTIGRALRFEPLSAIGQKLWRL